MRNIFKFINKKMNELASYLGGEEYTHEDKKINLK